MSTYWSCFTRELSDPFANRYDDAVGVQYDYDSRVPNSRQIARGDVVVLRDDHLAYGWGVISRVESVDGHKSVGACPRCGSTSKWGERKRLLPRFHCSKCGHDFPAVVRREVPITKFTAHYAETWLRFVAPAPISDLRPVFARGDQQNAIRRLDPEAARAFVARHQGMTSDVVVEIGDPDEWVHSGGFTEARAHVRRMQGVFRRKLLDRYGEVCAVTGSHPADVLDAAHLYSYATTPVHRERGGLLLRKDVHALFDAMLLTIDPQDARSHVAPALVEAYPTLEALDCQPLQVSAQSLPDMALLDTHLTSARERWKTLRRDFADLV